MTIATSVLIGPSKMMRCLLLCISVCACIAWICIGYWFLLRADLLVGGLGLVVAFLVFYFVSRIVLHALRQTSTFSLDVSRDGDVLLRRFDALGRLIESEPAKLRSPLILWSSLLLLTLKNESGKVTRLLILRDSVSDIGFRRLSLAFHWMAQAQTNASRQNDLSEGNF